MTSSSAFFFECAMNFISSNSFSALARDGADGAAINKMGVWGIL